MERFRSIEGSSRIIPGVFGGEERRRERRGFGGSSGRTDRGVIKSWEE
jgi:hypothetical protein